MLLPAFACFACADAHQAVRWLLRQDRHSKRLSQRASQPTQAVRLTFTGLAPGSCSVRLWDTVAGREVGHFRLQAGVESLLIDLAAVGTDLALAIVSTA